MLDESNVILIRDLPKVQIFNDEELKKIIQVFDFRLTKIDQALNLLDEERDYYLEARKEAVSNLSTYLPSKLEELEFDAIKNALIENNNNHSRTARALGISRRSLLRRLDKINNI